MQMIASLNRFAIVTMIVLSLGGSILICSAGNTVRRKESLESRMQRLEDREEVRQLLIDYGKFLDSRNFIAFSQLFAEKEGEWIGGMGQAKGSAAIRKFMEEKIGKNLEPPNCHIFANESIYVNGDRANSLTKWIFVTQGASSRPQMVFIGHYEDVFMREDGHWKFLQRRVHSDIPKDNTIRGVEEPGCKGEGCRQAVQGQQSN